MATAWIGLGSDLGHRVGHLRRGLSMLQGTGTAVEETSSLYLTEPVGDPDLPWFLNAVVRVDTALSAIDLLRLCLQVERRCGRHRRGTLQPRALDLDLLLYDDEVVDEEGIQVPHPRMYRRRFVLRPLAELDPHRPLPRVGRTAAELLDALPREEGVWLLASAEWAGSPSSRPPSIP